MYGCFEMTCIKCFEFNGDDYEVEFIINEDEDGTYFVEAHPYWDIDFYDSDFVDEEEFSRGFTKDDDEFDEWKELDEGERGEDDWDNYIEYSISEWIEEFDFDVFFEFVFVHANLHYEDMLKADYRYLGASFDDDGSDIIVTLSNGRKKRFKWNPTYILDDDDDGYDDDSYNKETYIVDDDGEYVLFNVTAYMYLTKGLIPAKDWVTDYYTRNQVCSE